MSTLVPVYSWRSPYIRGLNLTWVSNTSLTVATGSATNSDISNLIGLFEEVTIDATVNGAGGLDEGSLENSTAYGVFLIGLSADEDEESTSALISKHAVPILPMNFDQYRRIGYVVTDGSAHIRSFVQVGSSTARTMYYDTAIAVLTGGTSATYASVDLSAAVPLAAVTDVTLGVAVTPTAAGNSVNLLPYGSSATNGYAALSGSVGAVAQMGELILPVGLNAGVPTIKYKVTGSVSIGVTAYVDQL